MIFRKGEFVCVTKGIWQGHYGQIATVKDLDQDKFPYMVYIVDGDDKTQTCMFKGRSLRMADRHSDELHISYFLKVVKK